MIDHNIKDETIIALLKLTSECFFAVLPLIVYAISSNKPDAHCLGGFPELSMTSCVIFGITLIKLLQSSFYLNRNKTISREKTILFCRITFFFCIITFNRCHNISYTYR
jgi:hypothetical protein